MNLSGCHFVYAGVSSNQYNLRFVVFDTSDYLQINGDTAPVTVFNSHNNRNYFIADSLVSSPISFQAEVMNENEQQISLREQKDIERWLFNKLNYNRLYIDIADDCNGDTYDIINGKEYRYYFNCRFTNPSKILGAGGIVGYRFTVECDSYLLWQDELTKSFNLGHSSASDTSTIKINIDSDGEEYIYPKVTFNMGAAGGDITVINRTDDELRFTTFKGITPEVEFQMNSEINYISGNNYMKLYDKNFIRLLPGKNQLEITGDVSKIKIEWSNRKYL